MTEFVFALGVLALSIIGLAIGTLFGRAPPTTSCAGAKGPDRLRCADCPLRRASAEECER